MDVFDADVVADGLQMGLMRIDPDNCKEIQIKKKKKKKENLPGCECGTVWMVNADGFDVDGVDADDCKEKSIKKKEKEKTYCRQILDADAW